jgi:hypothetical protein
VPKPIGIIILFMFFLPILTVGGTYSASGTEMMSSLGIISEHIQFANFATSIGMAAFCPFLYRLVCIRREKMMCIVGFSLMYIFSYICAKTDSIFLLALCSLFMGFLRMVLMMVNLFTLIKYAGNVEATEKITPGNEPTTGEGWDKLDIERSAAQPAIYLFFMVLGQLGTSLTAWLTYEYEWQYVYYFMMGLLLLCILITFVTMPYHKYATRRFPINFKQFGNASIFCITLTCITYVLTYGKVLDWYDDPTIQWATVGAVVANYNDNIDPPVSVTDGSAYGNPYNITYTLRNSANAGLQLQMPLYNQTLYTTVSIAKTMDEISRLSYEKAREDLILEICKMYYLGQTTAEQVTLIKANITRLEELKNITVAFHDNGMAMEVDVKRVNINLENLKVQYDNVLAMQEQQLNLLKYIMDYPAEEQIALVPVNSENITPVELTGLSENLYELQLLQSQRVMAEKQKKMIGHGYIPSLNLTANWMFSAYTDKAYRWFHSGPSNHWFRSYGLGVSLRVPIFDGLDKRYKNRKAAIDIENIKLAQENTRKNLQTQYLNATNDLMNNQRKSAHK